MVTEILQPASWLKSSLYCSRVSKCHVPGTFVGTFGVPLTHEVMTTSCFQSGPH